jgi:hypothetical protein
MARYFTRQEAEALLPAISVVLRTIQTSRQQLRTLHQELDLLYVQEMGNGHKLHEKIKKLRGNLEMLTQVLREAGEELDTFGCELKDPDSGLIDFLSLRDGQEIYLCWLLGEDRITYWHDLHTGFAGRQPLDQED